MASVAHEAHQRDEGVPEPPRSGSLVLQTFHSPSAPIRVDCALPALRSKETRMPGRRLMALALSGSLALGMMATALAGAPPPGQIGGQHGYEGQPGNQGVQHG